MKPRLLVACERSGAIRRAFAAVGWDAWSCDVEEAEDNSPRHYKDKIQAVLNFGPKHWDLLIAHPPCRYLSASGLHWTTRGLRDPKLTDEAIKFAEALWRARVPRIAIENPRGCLSTRSCLGKPAQSIQPYQFGHDASKETFLWLKGLPALTLDPSQYVRPRMVCSCGRCCYEYGMKGCPGCGAEEGMAKPRWANQTDSGQNRLGPSPGRAYKRAITYQGIADAMAAQWGKCCAVGT